MKLHFLHRLFRGVILSLITLLILSSCIKQESFHDIPAISYRNLLLVFDNGQYAVRGIFSFNFQDGDGDIGLNPGDTFSPYNRAGDYYYNLVIHYFEKQDTGWVEVILNPPYSARIPVLNPGYSGKPIKGFISDTLAMDPAPDFDTVKLEFFIYDRALNQSNILITPDIVLKRSQ